jgi:hypothetical protein
MAPPDRREENTPDGDPDIREPDVVVDDGDNPPSPFPHPPWTVNLVLVAGAITLLFGILVNPVWLLVGSPFVLALMLWLYIRIFVRR